MIASALVAGMTVRAVLRVAVVTCIEFPAIGMLGVLVWKGACLGSKGLICTCFFFLDKGSLVLVLGQKTHLGSWRSSALAEKI